MRLYTEAQYVKIKYFDDEIAKKGKERYDSVPETNNKLFTYNEGIYLWTEDGVYDVRTGKKVEANPNKHVRPVTILEDNKKIGKTHRDHEWISHPSYGMIQITHTSGRSRLFGEMLEDCHYVTLEIDHGLVRHGTMKEEYFTEHYPIVEVRMSKAQLGELIFSQNNGVGVPCTIAYSEMDGYIEMPSDYKNILDTTEEEFREALQKETNALRGYVSYLKNIFINEKKSFSKGDIREIIEHLESISRDISGNLPSYMSKFTEHTNMIKSSIYSEARARVDEMLETATRKVFGDSGNQQLLIEAIKEQNVIEETD